MKKFFVTFFLLHRPLHFYWTENLQDQKEKILYPFIPDMVNGTTKVNELTENFFGCENSPKKLLIILYILGSWEAFGD